VLLFVNMSPDVKNEYIADGIPEEILKPLSAFSRPNSSA